MRDTRIRETFWDIPTVDMTQTFTVRAQFSLQKGLLYSSQQLAKPQRTLQPRAPAFSRTTRSKPNPKQSLDLSYNGLTPAAAIVIASACKDNTSLTR